MDVALLLLAGSGTALATGLGAVPVFLLGERAAALRPFMWGLAAGLMTVASVVGLLLPALEEGSDRAVLVGVAVGVAFLVATRSFLSHRDPHIGQLRGAGVRRALLVFLVLLAHSLPEGFAIGAAWASSTEGLGLYILLAIALQNIPEGTSMAIPMQAEGFGHKQQFWTAVATSAPQPVGAVAAYGLVELVQSLLTFSFGFAAGAMLALVAVELAPQLRTPGAFLGAAAGAALMLGLAAALGV